MGTRNITAVVHDGEIKISQYGQWDGYYKYTGREVLNFCREHLNSTRKREKFIEKLNLCKQVSPSFGSFMRKITEDMGMENGKEFCIPLNQLFPQMSRDTGWEILKIIHSLIPYEFKGIREGEEFKRVQSYPVRLYFDTDGEEYTNVIDLDNNMVYLLTSHNFIGAVLETLPIIQKTYVSQNCYLKFSLDNIPDEDTVDHQVEILFKENNY